MGLRHEINIDLVALRNFKSSTEALYFCVFFLEIRTFWSDESVKFFWRIEVTISVDFLFSFLSVRIISYFFANFGLFHYFYFNVLFFFQIKLILFLLTVVVLPNQYMFSRSLISDRISEAHCRSHNNTGFLDRFVPFPFFPLSEVRS